MIFKGGTNDMDNGQALCTWCHDLKTSEETCERIAWKRVEKSPGVKMKKAILGKSKVNKLKKNEKNRIVISKSSD